MYDSVVNQKLVLTLDDDYFGIKGGMFRVAQRVCKTADVDVTDNELEKCASNPRVLVDIRYFMIALTTQIKIARREH